MTESEEIVLHWLGGPLDGAEVKVFTEAEPLKLFRILEGGRRQWAMAVPVDGWMVAPREDEWVDCGP